MLSKQNSIILTNSSIVQFPFITNPQPVQKSQKMVTATNKKLLCPDIPVHVHDIPKHGQQKLTNRIQGKLIPRLNKKKLQYLGIDIHPNEIDIEFE